MSPIRALFYAGDRLDDAIATAASGLALSGPLAQLSGIPTVPDISITSAFVLVALTLGRMYFGHIREVELNRHKEAVISLEVQRLLAAEQAGQRGASGSGADFPAIRDRGPIPPPDAD